MNARLNLLMKTEKLSLTVWAVYCILILPILANFFPGTLKLVGDNQVLSILMALLMGYIVGERLAKGGGGLLLSMAGGLIGGLLSMLCLLPFWLLLQGMGAVPDLLGLVDLGLFLVVIQLFGAMAGAMRATGR